MMRDRHRHAVLCLALCLFSAAVAGCGSVDASSTRAAGSAPTALPTTGDLDTRCADTAGDTSGIDIAGVALVSQDDQLIVAFTFTAPVSTLGVLLLTVQADSQGAGRRQLGVQVVNGRPVSSAVATSPTGEPTRQFDNVHLIDREVHAAFPAETIQSLGSRWNWFATVGGADSIDDFCPGAAGTTLGNVAPIRVG